MSFFFTFNGVGSRLFSPRLSLAQNIIRFQRNLHHTTFRPRVFPVPQYHVKFQNTSQLLWSYFKAPTNLLFVTTNLIGLGILTTYRGLNTLASAETNNIKDGTIPVIDTRFDSRIDWSNHKGSIVDWESLFRSELGSKEKESQVNDFKPITEDDLLELGSEEVQDLPKERVGQLISLNLLELGKFYRELKTVLRTEKDYEKAYTLVRQRIDIKKNKSYEYHLKNGRLYDFYRKHSSLRNKLFSEINKQVTLDYMKNNRILKSESMTRVEFEKEFNNQIMKFSKVNTLQDKFLLRMGELFQKCNSSDYLWIFKKLNNFDQNENFKVLLNVLTLSMMRQASDFIKTEELFFEMLRNAVKSANKLIFEKCLSNLNLSFSDQGKLKRYKKATKIIRAITKGEKLFEYTYSLKTFLYALHGLLRFNYTKRILRIATKKIITDLQTIDDEHRVSFVSIPPNPKKPISAVFLKTPITEIPLELVDVASKVALKAGDRFNLTWCILAIARSSSLDTIEKIKRLNRFKEDCKVEELRSLIEKIQEVL